MPLEQVFSNGNTRLVKLKGRSMHPFLRNGEVLVVSPVDSPEVSLGDIVLYSDGGTLVCHRVFRKRGASFETKGDAQLRPDALIKPEQLIGRVTAVQKGSRTIRLDNLRGRVLNLLVSRLSVVTATLYIIMGKLKNAGSEFDQATK